MKVFIKFFALLLITLTSTFANAQDSYTFKVHLKQQSIDVLKNGTLFKQIPCSSGKNPGSTPAGKFQTYAQKDQDVWVENDGTELKYYYITKFNGNVAFHSLVEGNHPFVEEGKKLFSERKPSSMGCVRVTKEDAKWIYNLPLGATVEVLED
jgi:lipoprotein-anchoring transpeptidase ErfK/SrfK